MLSRAARSSRIRSLPCARLFSSTFTGPTKAFIDNEWVAAESGATFDVFNPATEEVIAQITDCGQPEVDRAVESASRALSSGDWGNTGGYQRGLLLNRLAALIEENYAEIVDLEVLDNGKPKGEMQAVDMNLILQCFRYYAGFADKITGQQFETSGPHAMGLMGSHKNILAYTRHEPVGVVGSIIPWNFPLLMAAWKLAPALACGCPVVLKTAEQTPLSMQRVTELIVQAGFPKGAINVIPGGPETGKILAAHRGVDKVAFTGSTSVGKSIIKASYETNMKRVSLELGGKSPVIVADDASMEEALALTQLGMFFNQGEVCNATSRILVDEKIYDNFVEETAKLTKDRVANVKDGFAEGCAQGPQVSQKQKERVLSFIKAGKAGGATLVAGGNACLDKGYFVEPTVFADCKDDMKIAQEEVFGPVMSVFKYSDLDEAIARANASEYGLAAGVVTRDMAKANYVVNNLKAGTVWVNSYHVFDTAMPFGGYKLSGWGRDLGSYAMSNYLETKSVMWNMNRNTFLGANDRA